MHCIITLPTVHLHLLNEGTVHSALFLLVASVTYLDTQLPGLLVCENVSLFLKSQRKDPGSVKVFFQFELTLHGIQLNP